MQSSEPAVYLEGVSHRYGASKAVIGATLSLPTGSATALVGPDGVGKSTLLGLIAGVRRVQAGDIRALGGDMRSSRHRDAVSARIAYMPQGLGRNLYATLTVVENIDFFGRLYGVPGLQRRARIARLLEATGLAPFPHRPAGKLSGGMKQKLGLCCALVHEPELLILDEPTTGVDPLSRRQFWRLIDEMRHAQPTLTLLVATAYMDEAERFEQIVAMDEGRILDAGLKSDVLSRAGATSVEQAYVALQKPDRRGRTGPLLVPPLIDRPGPPAIAAAGLTRQFGDFTAVDHVSFTIRPGEIFGFLGPNGCGKSTTMKMLTGLLPATSGSGELLGKPINAQDVDTRKRVGYVSQSFSLYEEISVRANLELHGRLFDIDERRLQDRIAASLSRFNLSDMSEAMPTALPLGIRQRLQLAAACLHTPEVLILDEPTSGVDPAARDRFWALLIEMSREQGVTIFVSTHFMNEAERCDRVSLMNAGRVLAIGTPAELCASRGVATLESAFISYLEQETAAPTPKPASPTALGPGAAVNRPENQDLTSSGHGNSLPRLWAFARRESLELLRDRIRLSFAVFVPMLLMAAFGYGISFDIENIRFAVLDRDQSVESRMLLEHFSNSRYFVQRAPILDDAEIDKRLLSGELRFAISIPPSFGRDLLQGRRPEVSFWLEGGNTFPAEVARAYIQGVVLNYEADQTLRLHGTPAVSALITPEPRFRYNQSFRSVVAIAPGAIMLLLIVVPAMLTAVGVVREKELGSITNVYASPARIMEFLIGKQIPYFAVGLVSFGLLLVLLVLLFGIRPSGSVAALTFAAALYVFAATSFGLFVSAFVKTQVAAVFATAIVTAMTAAHYSGFLFPASTLEGSARVMGLSFPSLWFQTISLGVLSKGLGAGSFVPEFMVLAGFGGLFLLLARAFVRKQGA